MYFVGFTDFSCLWISTLAVDSEEDNRTMKEFLALTFVTSDQQVSEVESPDCNHDNQTSNYHNIASLRVPIAESESDFETPDDEDDEDEENEEEEEEQKHSQVNTILIYSIAAFHLKPNCSVWRCGAVHSLISWRYIQYICKI